MNRCKPQNFPMGTGQDMSHVYNLNFSRSHLKKKRSLKKEKVELILIADWGLGTPFMIGHVLGMHKALGSVPGI